MKTFGWRRICSARVVIVVRIFWGVMGDVVVREFTLPRRAEADVGGDGVGFEMPDEPFLCWEKEACFCSPEICLAIDSSCSRT